MLANTLSSTAVQYHVICYLPPSIVRNLKCGLNFVNSESADRREKNPQKVRLIIYKDDDHNLVVCRNLCRHNGGNFIHDIEDSGEIVRCTFHGWKLNAKTLNSTNPPNCLKQEPLMVEMKEDGTLAILESSRYEPWTMDTQKKQVLKPDELTVSYISHACVEIQAAGITLVTDPWLTGPAFGRGWWLLHEPESNAYDLVANADAIYISHAHPDHFNLPTLRRIAKINPSVPIYIPKLEANLFKNEFEELGFTNFKYTPLGCLAGTAQEWFFRSFHDFA